MEGVHHGRQLGARRTDRVQERWEIGQVVGVDQDRDVVGRHAEPAVVGVQCRVGDVQQSGDRLLLQQVTGLTPLG